MRTVSIKGSGLAAAEPIWGSILLTLFVAIMRFVLVNVLVVLAVYAYRDARAAVADEEKRAEINVSGFIYYKLLQWLSRFRHETMGHESNQFNAIESAQRSVTVTELSALANLLI